MARWTCVSPEYPITLGKVDPALERHSNLDRSVHDDDVAHERQKFLAALDGDDVLAGRQIDGEGMVREGGVHFDAFEIVAALLLVGDGRSADGTGKVPRAVGALDVDPRRQPGAAIGINDFAAQAIRFRLDRLRTCEQHGRDRNQCRHEPRCDHETCAEHG